MRTALQKIRYQFDLLLNELQISFICKLLSLLLLSSFMVSCSKDDPAPAKMETGLIDNPKEEPKEEEEEEEEEEETPTPVIQNDIANVDSAVLNFLAEHNVPGAAIAVSVNEKMVYTKGYGLSNVENNIPTKADDIFRIASISKPFTATAILKLVDEDKLALTDKVFGPNGVLGDDFGTATLSSNELAITIDHLLIHGLGGWGTVTGDPIDQMPQLDADQFIEHVLNNWDVPNIPGTQYQYSNTGYWLLARIIERTTEESYEEYVRNMLAPIGITSFKTTSFREEDRESNEVEYYGTDFDSQFIYNIASRRDGDGGVAINAPDLLRFLSALDGSSFRQDILSENSLNLMSSPSEISHLGRGLGTWEAENLLFFTGSLPGTRTWFYMNKDGISAVIFLNYRRTDIPEFDNDLNSLAYFLAKNSTIPWQTDLDQF